MIKISVLNTQSGIPEHLLSLPLVAIVSAPGTIPAPFRVVFEWLLLFEHCARAPHPHSHGCRPLPAFLAFLVRFHCLLSLLKSQRSLLCGAGCSARPTWDVRGCLRGTTNHGKSNGAPSCPCSLALWPAVGCSDFAAAAADSA